MIRLWTWVDKRHSTKLPAGRWSRVVFTDDADGTRHTGGTSPSEQGGLAQAQLYLALARTTSSVSVRFVRVYSDGRPDDHTGYQDIASVRRATLTMGPLWLGKMSPDFALAVELRPNGGTATLGTRIYKGYA